MKVAIWGSYEHGNFGDDLMAIIFANHLKKIGCSTIVFRLDKKIAERYGLQTTDSIDTLLKDTSLILIGGGGMLVVDSSIRRFFSRVAWRFEKDFKELYLALKKYDAKVVPLSIGGNGENKPNLVLPKYRQKVFQECCDKGTMRLSGDIPLAEKLNINYECIPDILLATSKLFSDVSKRKKASRRIGVNILGASASKLSLLLEEYCRDNEDIEIVFINTHLDGYGHNYEVKKVDTDCKRITNFCHQDDFSRTFELLSSLDLLISSKLHLGLTSMTFGTPFIGYQGKKKTNSFLKSVSTHKTVYSEKDEDEILRKLKDGDFYKFDEMYDIGKFDDYSAQAMNHLTYLEKVTNDLKVD